MANFFSRLAERSLGLSPVVRPAIAPRFSATPAIVDEVEPHWDHEADYAPTPVDTNPSVGVPLPPSISPVQTQRSSPKLGSAINSVQKPAQQNPSITPSLPDQLIQPASTLPESNFEQPLFPTAGAIAPTQSITQEPNQNASLEPFRVLQPRQQVPIEQHPSLSTVQPNSALPNASEKLSNHSLAQPITPQNRSDRSIASNQIPPTQPAAQTDLRPVISSPFPQVSTESTAVPPTIRVSIGRVEVRAMMPTQPAPKVAPAVRPRPPVSLNDYLKQRGESAMSNDLAIATVTATLKRVLENAVTGRIPSTAMTITVGQPDPRDAATNNDGRVNIFLYQVTHNPGWRNADLPTRRANGSLSQRPQLALDLHYLLSFYGDKTKLLPERLMGLVMKTLHVQPFLTRQMIQRTVENTDYLEGSNLDKQPELVKFSPVSLSLEELSKIWSIFFQTQYVLSTAYQGTVVLIEPEDEPNVSLPVGDRRLEVAATPLPVPVAPLVITQVRSQAGVEELITAGSELLISGRAFTKGAIASIQIADQAIIPTEQAIQDNEIRLPLPDSLAAGVKTLQIIDQQGDRSNLAKFILRPQIVSVTRQSRQIQLTLDLPIVKGQKIVVVLNAANTPEQSSTLSQVAPEDVVSRGTIAIPIPSQTEIKSGRYTVRVQVDGAESPSQEVTLS